jgi:hypothetical protein
MITGNSIESPLNEMTRSGTAHLVAILFTSGSNSEKVFDMITGWFNDCNTSKTTRSTHAVLIVHGVLDYT